MIQLGYYAITKGTKENMKKKKKIVSDNFVNSHFISFLIQTAECSSYF